MSEDRMEAGMAKEYETSLDEANKRICELDDELSALRKRYEEAQETIASMTVAQQQQDAATMAVLERVEKAEKVNAASGDTPGPAGAAPDHTLICPSCGADRLKEPCRGKDATQCKMGGVAYSAGAAPVNPAVPVGYVLVPQSALDWLFGCSEEKDFDCPPEMYFRGKQPPYWWRSVFRKMIEDATPPSAPEDARAKALREAAPVVFTEDMNNAAMAEFSEYFLANYGPGCVISNPAWHVPKIYAAAKRAILALIGKDQI
jgi:hypothetical protein